MCFPACAFRSRCARTVSRSSPKQPQMDECARPADRVLRSLGGGQGHPVMGDPALEGREATSGMVTWRDSIGPGERLHSPRPAGKSWIDHGGGPFARSPLLTRRPLGSSTRPSGVHLIVRPGLTGAIRRTTQICTGIVLVFGEVGVSTCFMARHRHSGRCRPHETVPNVSSACWHAITCAHTLARRA